MAKTNLDLLDNFCPKPEKPSAQYKPGDIINGYYQIEKDLSTGNLGYVYLCRDCTREHIRNSMVVLKTIKADPYSSNHINLLNAFNSEYNNWLNLPANTYFVKILNAFYDYHTNMPFIVLPYIEGHPKLGLTIQDWLDNGYHFNAVERLNIAFSISHAFWLAAQENGEIHPPVHGDIKPDNIFLECSFSSEDPSVMTSYQVLLSDCGCSGKTAGYYPDGYSAINQSTDVYALGMMLNVLTQHAEAEPPSLESRYLDKLIKSILKENAWQNTDLFHLHLCIRDFLRTIPNFSSIVEVMEKPASFSREDQIYFRAQYLYSRVGLFDKKNNILDDLISLRQEAFDHQYIFNTIFLFIFLDYYIFQCALQLKIPDISKKYFDLFRQEYLTMDERQRAYFNHAYSFDFEVDFTIQEGRIALNGGNRSHALELFRRVPLEKCFDLSWLNLYADICCDSHTLAEEKLNFEENLSNLHHILPKRQDISEKRKEQLLYQAGIVHGRILRNLGDTDKAVIVHSACHNIHQDNNCLYHYGLSLVMNRQPIHARRIFFELYNRCLQIRRRSSDKNGNFLYPHQTNATHLFVAAYFLGKFNFVADEWRAYTASNSTLESSDNIQEFFDRTACEYREMHLWLEQIKSLDDPNEQYAALSDQQLVLYGKLRNFLEHPDRNTMYCLQYGRLLSLLEVFECLCESISNCYRDNAIMCSKLLTCEAHDMLKLCRDSEKVYYYLWQAHKRIDLPDADDYRQQYEKLRLLADMDNEV